MIKSNIIYAVYKNSSGLMPENALKIAEKYRRVPQMFPKKQKAAFLGPFCENQKYSKIRLK